MARAESLPVARAEELPAAARLESTASRRWRALRRNRVALLGGCIFGLAVLVALLAPWLTPYDPVKDNLVQRLQRPSAAHLFGTDDFGRDVFSRTIDGTRISLQVGGAVVVACSVLGVALGLVAGYYRRVDDWLMRILDGLMAFPATLLAIAIASALRGGLWNVVIALTAVYMPRFVRLLRGPVLSAKNSAYVEAARVVGASDWAIMFRHLLPNTFAPLIVQATFTFAYAILAEASLSFLGIGVPPPAPSWGNIISDGRVYLHQAWWMTVAPGTALMLTTLSLNLFGDALRDAFDPRQVVQR